MTKEQLQKYGIKEGSACEGTVIFYLSPNGIEYAVLQDNTVILKKDWDSEEAK